MSRYRRFPTHTKTTLAPSNMPFSPKLLTRALSMYVTSVGQRFDGSSDSHAPEDSPVSDWSVVAFSVAEQMGVDGDALRRHFVCELYSAGLDGLGSEVSERILC